MNQLTIVHAYPELLNLYGDRGNVTALAKRCEWRGIPVCVVEVPAGEAVDFSQADILYLGGGADREQLLAQEALAPQAQELAAYIEANGVVLAACGSFPMLGHTCVVNGEQTDGLGILDMNTQLGQERHIGNAAVQTDVADAPVIGFENHASLTTLGAGLQPLGRVLGSAFGNNGQDGTEGVHYRNLLGTYLHGPVLPKNPHLADWLITRALERRGQQDFLPLASLEDTTEQAAHAYMAAKLGL